MKSKIDLTNLKQRLSNRVIQILWTLLVAFCGAALTILVAVIVLVAAAMIADIVQLLVRMILGLPTAQVHLMILGPQVPAEVALIK